jgi:hypothetical protein
MSTCPIVIRSQPAGSDGAPVLRGQVASASCFRPVPSCYLSRAGRLTRAMSSPVSGVHPVACGESIGAGLYPASCFFPVIYREIQGKLHVLRRRCSSLAMLAQRRSGDCAQVERDNRQSSGLERGVHLPDAVPLRQMTRQRKQQKRCRLAPSRNAREGFVVPSRPNPNLSSIAFGAKRTSSRGLPPQRCVLSTEPYGRPGPADSQKTTIGVELALREQTIVEPDLRDASSPKDTRGRDTVWRRSAEPELRPDEPVETIVVQYDGVTIQAPDILGGCFRPGEATAQIDRHRQYRD